MNKRFGLSSQFKLAAVIAALASLSAGYTATAETSGGKPAPSLATAPAAKAEPSTPARGAQGDDYTPSFFKPYAQPPAAAPAEAEQTALNQRLSVTKKDLAAWQSFAEYTFKYGDLKVLTQLRNPVDDYLGKHVNNLLEQVAENAPPETARLTAEILCVKTRLFLSLSRREEAQNTVAEMRKRFISCPQMTVDFLGKTATLDQGIRTLEELIKTASAANK